MNELAQDIKSRGYWQTLFRPREYDTSRVDDLSVIPDLLSTLKISRRGWHFPHVRGQDATIIGNDWVGQDTVRNQFRELWRVTKSGQLLHLAGIRYDWGGPRHLSPFEDYVGPEELIIGIGDTLHRMSEIFEFAQRWAQAMPNSRGVEVVIDIGGLQGRRLVVDHGSRGGFSVPYVAKASESWKRREDIAIETTLEELWARARESTAAFVQRFGFKPNDETMEDWQRKIGQ